MRSMWQKIWPSAIGYSATGWEGQDGDHEDSLLSVFLEQQDEDALFAKDFEDQTLQTLQNSLELAPVFVAYQEARARLQEKARSRGFSPSETRQRALARRATARRLERPEIVGGPWSFELPTAPADFVDSQVIGSGSVRTTRTATPRRARRLSL